MSKKKFIAFSDNIIDWEGVVEVDGFIELFEEGGKNADHLHGQLSIFRFKERTKGCFDAQRKFHFSGCHLNNCTLVIVDK